MYITIYTYIYVHNPIFHHDPHYKSIESTRIPAKKNGSQEFHELRHAFPTLNVTNQFLVCCFIKLNHECYSYRVKML